MLARDWLWTVLHHENTRSQYDSDDGPPRCAHAIFDNTGYSAAMPFQNPRRSKHSTASLVVGAILCPIASFYLLRERLFLAAEWARFLAAEWASRAHDSNRNCSILASLPGIPLLRCQTAQGLCRRDHVLRCTHDDSPAHSSCTRTVGKSWCTSGKAGQSACIPTVCPVCLSFLVRFRCRLSSPSED